MMSFFSFCSCCFGKFLRIFEEFALIKLHQYEDSQKKTKNLFVFAGYSLVDAQP
ncbi:hypothetical protein [Anabaena sp. 4-3]|uniref:hypothetical protein n=1 Tax=Anabaena sp. 4-3 TaxID=1811979 RepID=UPI000B0BC445|nr:hypothetical protein [Anabaena sp. 4-3]